MATADDKTPAAPNVTTNDTRADIEPHLKRNDGWRKAAYPYKDQAVGKCLLEAADIVEELLAELDADATEIAALTRVLASMREGSEGK